MLDYINNEIKPDIAFWGGDSVPHNMDSSFDRNLETLVDVTRMVKSGLKDVKLYGAIGNHDTYPQSKWVGKVPEDNEVLQRWKYEWKELFTEQKQYEDFGAYGHYAQELTFKNGTKIGTQPAKVLSFNSNYCLVYDYYSWVQWEDPGHSIEWLENELSELEKVGGAAILLTHIPNVDECVQGFSRRWHALMDRYQHVIRWTMSGHMHQEFWNVERSIMTQEPIMMNIVIGSVSPLTSYSPYDLQHYKKPSFVVLEMDRELLIPINIKTYTFDIKYANKYNQPKWEFNYDMQEVYGLKDLSPKSFYEYALNMARDEKSAQIYLNHQYIGYLADDQNLPCDERCRLDVMCYALSNDYDDEMHCMGYPSFELFSHNEQDSLAPMHSVASLWSSHWWRAKR